MKGEKLPAAVIINSSSGVLPQHEVYYARLLAANSPIQPCLEYAERMRTAGNANIRLAVYPGVYHAYDWTGGIAETADDDFRRCSVYWKTLGVWIDRASRAEVPVNYQWLMKNCVDRMRPHRVGGDRRVQAQSSADMLQFLRDASIIEDADARAVVPDCDTLPKGIHQYNCIRARSGWTGDIVGLARAYRYADGVARDDRLAARLFRLAVKRGHPRAQWELADMMRLGLGGEHDIAASLPLVCDSAASGEPAAMNLLGLYARDGLARSRDEAKAVAWFRKAAILRNDYAFYNLGRMYWDGRGCLAKDHAEAVRPWRKAAFQNNPLARLALAEALEKGDGTRTDIREALDNYRAVAAQDREPDAKRRAAEAVARLENVAR